MQRCIEVLQANVGNRLEMETNSGLIGYQVKQKAVSYIPFSDTRSSSQLILQVAGDGTLLTNALLVTGMAPLAALPVVPAVGTTITATISPNGLTHQAILNLIQLYDFDFGIQPNEVLVAIRWQRILNWLTTDV